MANISVNTAQLAAQADELEALNGQFFGAIDNLNTTELYLFLGWEGEANTEFHSAFSNDIVQMKNFYNAVGMYVARLREIIARYQLAEERNAEIGRDRTYR